MIDERHDVPPDDREAPACPSLAPAAGLFGLAGVCDDPCQFSATAQLFYRIGYRDGRLMRARSIG